MKKQNSKANIPERDASTEGDPVGVIDLNQSEAVAKPTSKSIDVDAISEVRLDADVRAHLNRSASDVVNPQHVFLRPAAAAKLLDVSIKWLSAAREGRKGIDGPPFTKLGIRVHPQ